MYSFLPIYIPKSSSITNPTIKLNVKFNSTQTIYEREYVCIADENEFQHSTNKSLKIGQSGSISTAPLSPSSSIYFKTIYDEYPYNLVGYSTSSYDTSGFDIGTELIGEAVLALQLESTVKEFSRGIRVHPTFSESVVDSARDALNWALYLPRS